YGPQNDVTLKMPAFEWVHVQLHQQKGMISLSPPTICNSAFENPRALIRYQDGSASGLMVASRVGDFQLSVPHLSEFDDPMKVDLSSATIEPIRLVFCGSTRHVYDAIVEEIAPQSDGTCQVTAKEYLESFYAYDDATYPGDVA
ncbi:hypothetical protein MU299_27875, partial [Klebsiella pneumoniae]|nr:hypothetical protein [Klebsiella pneumoniae]